MSRKAAIVLKANQKQVKDLKIGEIVTINMHDYYFKGVQEVKQERGGYFKQIAFWSVKTEFKKYFNLELLEHIVTQKTDNKEDGYNW